MHLLLLTARMPPAVDGVGDYTAFLARALARRGVRVTLACRQQQQYTPLEGVSLWNVPLEQAERDTPQWIDQLIGLRPDWCVLQYVPYAFQHRGLPFHLPYLLKRIRAAGVRVGIFFHEVHVRLRENFPIGIGQRWIAQQLCRHADAVLTSIPFYQQILAQLGAHAHLLPIGANIEVPQPTSPATEHPLGAYFPDKKWVISTFGRRNLQNLAAAIRQLPDAGLLVIGRADVAHLGTMPGTHATGYVPASEVYKWLRCSDIFALPDPIIHGGRGGTSLKSGSLAAAFAAALPVIGVAGDMTAPPLEHGSNIWLVNETSPGGWMQALQTLLSQPLLCQRLAQNGYALYQQQLHWDVLANTLVRLLNSQ